MKKLGLLLFGIAHAASVLAGAMNASPDLSLQYKKDFYIGANLSGDYSKYNIKLTDIRFATGLVNRFGQTHLTDIAIAGGLFAGFAIHFPSPFYLGVEGFLNFSDNEAKAAIFDDNPVNLEGLTFASFNVRNKRHAGVAVLPGIKINNNTLAYARAGYINGALKVSGEGRALLATGVVTTFNNEHDLNGFQTGLGLNTTLSKNLSLRGEWVINIYQSFTDPVINRRGLVEGSLIFNHPTTSQFNLGLVYHFNDITA
ncbi:outer membrane beta-barrel protein [Legionella sp. MW5194]|uniref:outer membrane protein n=1 Tax=Legionella sp. MW5194 TaxID=2662448 RepID=UPI00193E0F15|nr:outer membrane beta-barrel protein [Legionella sp. MW5194]QRN02570.1 outer membrane beta-barrel protein [Legionella sp. MW5194]